MDPPAGRAEAGVGWTASGRRRAPWGRPMFDHVGIEVLPQVPRFPARVRFRVDGEDLVEEVIGGSGPCAGRGPYASDALPAGRPGPLRATGEARRLELGQPDRTGDCCGFLAAVVQRFGGTVQWSDGEVPSESPPVPTPRRSSPSMRVGTAPKQPVLRRVAGAPVAQHAAGPERLGLSPARPWSAGERSGPGAVETREHSARAVTANRLPKQCGNAARSRERSRRSRR